MVFSQPVWNMQEKDKFEYPGLPKMMHWSNDQEKEEYNLKMMCFNMARERKKDYIYFYKKMDAIDFLDTYMLNVLSNTIESNRYKAEQQYNKEKEKNPNRNLSTNSDALEEEFKRRQEISGPQSSLP